VDPNGGGISYSVMHIHHVNRDGAKVRREAAGKLLKDEATVSGNVNSYLLMLKMSDDELFEQHACFVQIVSSVGTCGQECKGMVGIGGQ